MKRWKMELVLLIATRHDERMKRRKKKELVQNKEVAATQLDGCIVEWNVCCAQSEKEMEAMSTMRNQEFAVSVTVTNSGS